MSSRAFSLRLLSDFNSIRLKYEKYRGQFSKNFRACSKNSTNILQVNYQVNKVNYRKIAFIYMFVQRLSFHQSSTGQKMRMCGSVYARSTCIFQKCRIVCAFLPQKKFIVYQTLVVNSTNFLRLLTRTIDKRHNFSFSPTNRFFAAESGNVLYAFRNFKK